MGTYKQGNLYWNQKHEALVLQWTTATTEIEYTRIHNALRPALNFMAELILNRYFTCPFARQNEMKADAVQHCFLLMKKYHPSKVKNKNGAYSFCSMVIKHYYMDNLVTINDRKNVVYNKLDYFDELPPEAQPIDYGETKELPTQRILSHFKDILAKTKYELVQEIKVYRRSKRVPRVERFKTRIELITRMIEFIEKYNSLDAASMADYVFIHQNRKLKKTSVGNYMRKICNVNVVVNLAAKDRDSVKDKKYDYIQDDYVPADLQDKWKRRSKRKTDKEVMKYNYF